MSSDVAPAAPATAGGQSHDDWPSYMGPGYGGADRSGVPLLDDMTKARLVWDGAERRIGFGKTTTTYPQVGREFGDLPPGGAASPIVAGGAVILSYFDPSGDVTDADFLAKAGGGADPAARRRALVAADDVVIAVDAAGASPAPAHSTEPRTALAVSFGPASAYRRTIRRRRRRRPAAAIPPSRPAAAGSGTGV